MMYSTEVNAFDDDTETILDTMRQVGLLTMRHLLDRDVLSVPAMEVLHWLDAEGPTRLTALAQALHVTQPAMTQLIQRLEQRGLVSRMADRADGRVTITEVTDSGHELLAQICQEELDRLNALLSTLTTRDRQSLLRAMSTAGPIINRLNANAAIDASRASGSAMLNPA